VPPVNNRFYRWHYFLDAVKKRDINNTANMKKLSMLFVALCVGLSAWAQQQSAGTTKTNADFAKYKTFSWAKADPTAVGPNGYEIWYYEVTPGTPGEINRDTRKRPGEVKTYGNKPTGYVYSYNVIIPSSVDETNTIIKDGVENELIGRGYRENEASPDMLVVYQVFDQRATLHGYTPTEPSGPQGSQVRQPSDTTTFVLEPGTLMVSLIDAKTSEMVWNGFSSGLIDNSTFINDDADIKEAIHTIFTKFQHQADKASRDYGVRSI
jgi:hypothetical protein